MIKTTKNKNDMDEKTTKLSNNTNPTVTYDTVNWEQRRYEIAKSLFPIFVQEWWRADGTPFNETIGEDLDDSTIKSAEEGIAEISVAYADELIKWLKK